MTNVFSSPDDQREASMMASNHLSNWDGLRRFADELELQVHLASMEMRDRWQKLEPRVTTFQQVLARTSERAGNAVRAILRKLRN